MSKNSNSQSDFTISISKNTLSAPPADHEYITKLLSRQDEVLSGLDELNERVLLAIEELNAARKSEQAPQTSKADSDEANPEELGKAA